MQRGREQFIKGKGQQPKGRDSKTVSSTVTSSGPSSFNISVRGPEPGTIKKTWIDPSDYTILKSKMFNNLQDAKLFEPESKRDNYLYFQLQSYGKDDLIYTWKLLPYGKHSEYVNGMKLKDNPIAKYGIPALALCGAFFLGKMIIKKIKT